MTISISSADAPERVGNAAQARGEFAQTLARPKQRRLRIPARRRLDQRTQIIEQARIHLAQRLASAARPAHAVHILYLPSTQFAQPTTDRAARQACGAHDSTNAATTGCYSLGCRQTPQAALVQHRSKRFEPLADGRFINHADMIYASQLRWNPSHWGSQKSIQLFADGALADLKVSDDC